MVRVRLWPPLLEALGAGAIDYGSTGDSPLIFSVGRPREPALRRSDSRPRLRQAIVVPAASLIQDVSGLACKKVAVAKASSARNLLVAALECVKLPWSSVTPVCRAS
jgi:sulfonate transport system substrate-binding protein